MSEPKTILWDIETSHNIVASFRLWDQNNGIPFQNVLQERYIICAAWKELGKHKIHTVSVLDDRKRFNENPHDDKYVCTRLAEVLNSADIIVGHNGDEYDIKFTEGRMLAHQMPPLAPVNKIDTLKIARRKLLLNSNRLDYIARYLGIGKKVSTPAELWLEVLRHGSGKSAIKAIRTMLRYNKGDVALLEKVYLRLRPYAENVPALIDPELKCPRCGSSNLNRQGTRVAVTRIYQRWQCRDCGGWARSTIANSGSAKIRTL